MDFFSFLFADADAVAHGLLWPIAFEEEDKRMTVKISMRKGLKTLNGFLVCASRLKASICNRTVNTTRTVKSVQKSL